MAPVVLTPDEQAVAMKAGSSELKYLFAREGVPEKFQALFYHHKVISMAKLSNLAETTADGVRFRVLWVYCTFQALSCIRYSLCLLFDRLLPIGLRIPDKGF